ncbi:FAD-dependent oxidoreductase [Thalassoglobus sp. JC818]|uniref:NAD(P)/FAD-dependent oxidoreductase n=1 Tax=Thalassoglobus sp. JC818 TaxID=3232136 RepID=UPI003458F636
MTDTTLSTANNSMNSQAPSITILGGGVVGAACAYYLSQTGAKVTILEKGTFGGACSHGNCGFISPSHILPLCQPGAIQSTLKTFFQRNSAFSISPRWDPALWRWLLKFASNCNRQHMLSAGRARQALLDSSRELYASLIETGVLNNCDWHSDGLLFVHHSAKSFEHYREVDKLLTEEFGLSAKAFPGEDLNELEPALKPGLGGGWLYECDAHIHPSQLMAAWRACLDRQGVEIREQTEVLNLNRTRSAITEIETTSGKIKVDQLIVALGAWTPQLMKQLGLSLPIQPGKGYSLTMPRPENCPRYPMIFEEHRVAITPLTNAYRIGSTMQFAGYDTSLPPSRLNLLLEGAKEYLHTPTAEPVQEQWYGWRPMSADGVPMIGQVPKFDNTWVASGHSMLGVSMAPATGKLMAELVTRAPTHVDTAPYRLNRF